MLLPAGGFFVLAGWLLFFNWVRQDQVESTDFGGRSFMNDIPAWSLFINACLINNFVLVLLSRDLPVFGRFRKNAHGDAHGCRRNVCNAGQFNLRLWDSSVVGGD